MNKIYIILIIFVSFTINSCGQSNKSDCEKILNKEFDLNKIEEDIETFKKDFKTFMLCEFDTVDYQIMIGPKADMIDVAVEMLKYLEKTEKEKLHNFSDIAKGIKVFKKTDEYKLVRKIVETRNILVVKNASLSNWKEDEEKLKAIRFDDKQIEIIKGIVAENEGKTYQEIFELAYPFLVETGNNINKNDKNAEEVLLDASPIMTCKNVIRLWEDGYTFKSYSECLDCSEKINRPILFYFSGHGSIECREFEVNVLIKPDIKDIINNKFAYITFFTDAVEKLGNSDVYFSKLQKKEIKTEGGRNLDIQLEKFENSQLPYFVIVSQNGTILREYKKGADLAKFKEFLNK